MDLAQELAVARNAAYQAGALQLKRLQNDFTVERKCDRSPVTDVDRDCEEIIRSTLLSRFPADGFLGEESGFVAGTSGRRWIVDPLDGTRPYIRGIPTFSVLLALVIGDDPVLGVIHLPALRECCWACRGAGAFLNDRPIRVSSVDTLSGAMGSAMGLVETTGSPEGRNLMKLMGQLDYAYGFMDAYSYVAVASGKLDVCVSLLDKPWDCAAAACIVREAGGMFSDVHGSPSFENGSAVATNGAIHASVLKMLVRVDK